MRQEKVANSTFRLYTLGMKSSTDAIRSVSKQLLQFMINADRAEAARLVEKALGDGLSSETIISSILDPALLKLGHLWGTESVSLAQTFVAAKIAEDVLVRCMQETGPEIQKTEKGVVVIGNIEDDFHSLGRRIVASFLRANGWMVYDLGNDVTAEQFLEKALQVSASVIGVSAMMQTTALNIRKLRDLIDSRGLQKKLKIAVGGAVFNWRPELVTEVGGDGTAQNAAEASELFLALQSRARGGK
jgi:methylmalonyl-CoA mutase cobalamin-binding domain/chain